MSGKLTLDYFLEGCTVGESKTLSLVVTPTKNDEDGFKADVESVEEYEEDDGGKEAKHGKGTPAVVIAITGGKMAKK